MPATKVGFDQCVPPSCELTIRYWSSPSAGDSYSDVFWLLMYAT